MNRSRLHLSILIAVSIFCLTVCPLIASDRTKKPVIQEADKIVVRVPDLIPEGISYDPATDRFLLSSFRYRGILAVERDGSHTWLADPGQADGLLATAGLLVDSRRGVLWACTGNVPHLKSKEESLASTTGLVAIDLASGAEKKKFVMQKKDLFHVFNDVTQAPDGRLYVSGFSADVIYSIHPDEESIAVWAELDEGSYPNGIALKPDGRLLYVATQSGITAIDMATKSQQALQAPESLQAIDGLYTWNNSLVAVQHLRPFGERGTRIIQAFLNTDGTEVSRIIELHRNMPEYNQPTTGVIVGDSFYYIANSQFSAFDDSFNLNTESLKPVIILRVSLLRTFPGPSQ